MYSASKAAGRGKWYMKDPIRRQDCGRPQAQDTTPARLIGQQCKCIQSRAKWPCSLQRWRQSLSLGRSASLWSVRSYDQQP